MTANVRIDLSNPMALPLLDYLESLPFADVEIEKKSFEQASAECNAVALEEFIEMLHKRVDELYDKREAEHAKASRRENLKPQQAGRNA